MTHGQNKNEWNETDPEVAKTVQLANEDFKLRLLNVLIDWGRNMNITREMEDF